MSKEYEFTKLSEVEVTSELKDGDVILVVQDGAVKRYTGKVGGSSVCYIEFTEDDIITGGELMMLSHTFYDTVLNAVNKNERILFSTNMMGMDIKFDAIASMIVPVGAPMPEGIIISGFFEEGITNILIPKEEYVSESPS